VLRWLRGNASLSGSLAVAPQISFNYLGQFDQQLPPTVPLGFAAESPGSGASLGSARLHLLDVTALMIDGRLQVGWTFSRDHHRSETIERLASSFLDSLRRQIEHCRLPDSGGCSPADFPLAGLSQPALDRLVGSGRNVEDVYPLYSLQAGLLFHSVFTPQSRMYYEQFVGRLVGAIDPAALRQAWQHVVDAHTILRTGFAWDGLERPLQIVYRRAELPWDEHDLRDVSRRDADSRWMALLESDRQRGLELGRPPLMRITLARISDQEWRICWSHHHLILDGWSLPLLLDEVLVAYEAHRRGHSPPLPRLRPYVEFIQWLERQDPVRDERYWRNKLRGFTSPTPLHMDRPKTDVATAAEQYVLRQLELTESLSSALSELVRAHQLTMSTLMQGAWALLLSQSSSCRDVVFGATVSGRSAPLPGIQSMVGLFINMVPVRIQVDPGRSLLQWLRELRDDQAELRQHEYTPLNLVQRWSDFPPGRPLFESTLAYENYPIDRSFQQRMASFDIRDAEHLVGTNYPLVWMIVPGDRISLRVRYHAQRFAESAVVRMLENFQAILQAIADQPYRQVSEFEAECANRLRDQTMGDQHQREQSRLDKLLKARPRTVSIPSHELVAREEVRPGHSLPLVLRPTVSHFDACDWAANHRDQIERDLAAHGAILFRGINAGDAPRFEEFARVICRELFTEYGDLPREKVGRSVYGSTVYPQDLRILFHHESSHQQTFPGKILFCCQIAALRGGETPLVDGRRIYGRLPDRLRQRFEKDGVMYVRNFTEGLDVSWQEFFRSSDRAQVEERCRREGVEFEWIGDHGLRTRQRRPAVVRHPATNDRVFFNQIQLHHASCLDPAVQESMRTLFGEHDWPRHVLYGDGTPIDDQDIHAIRKLYDEEAQQFAWQVGDVLLVDNVLVAHGRNPYEGPRKILVALGDMQHAQV
jgi:non-ribosomal peptide synthase protein (TIGR01720 family)